MFHSVYPFGGVPQGPLRRLPSLGAGLLGLLLLGGCSQGPPKPANAVETNAVGPNQELRFDERYLDSLSGPTSKFSARTWRELAIRHQLTRLELARIPLPASEPDGPVSTQTEVEGPLVIFPNEAADLADIYRRIDSLKVLEHLPVTPHPPLQPLTHPHHAR